MSAPRGPRSQRKKLDENGGGDGFSLTQLSDAVLGDVAREDDGTSEERCVGSSVKQPEALVLAHLRGRLPRRLHNAAVHHLGVERGRRRHCNTTQAVNQSGTTT